MGLLVEEEEGDGGEASPAPLPQGDWVWLKKFPGDQHSEVKPATKLAFCKVRGCEDHVGSQGRHWVMGMTLGHGDHVGSWGQCWVMEKTLGHGDDIEARRQCCVMGIMLSYGENTGPWGQCWVMGVTLGHGDHVGSWGPHWVMETTLWSLITMLGHG